MKGTNLHETGVRQVGHAEGGETRRRRGRKRGKHRVNVCKEEGGGDFKLQTMAYLAKQLICYRII